MFKSGWINGIKNLKDGFTLVEIIVTLSIIAILAATAIPSMTGFVDKSNEKAFKNEVKLVKIAASAYANDCFWDEDFDTDVEENLLKNGGQLGPDHCLYPYLKADVTGRIIAVDVDKGKVKSLSYVKDNTRADYAADGEIIITHDFDVAQVSTSAPEVSSEPSPEIPPEVSSEPEPEIPPEVSPTPTQTPTQTPTPTPAPKTATFDTGQVVNEKMGDLAGSTFVINGIVQAEYSDYEAVNKYTADTNHILSAPDSEYQIYAWYANDNLYYYTEADEIYLNADSSYLFSKCAISNTSGLANLHTENVTNLSNMFYGCYNLSDISGLANLHTENVTNLSNMFCRCFELSDISTLANWNTKNVTDLSNMFCYCSKLSDISALANWNTENVESLESTFSSCYYIEDATCLNGWNTSKVMNFTDTFKNTTAAGEDKLPSWYPKN